MWSSPSSSRQALSTRRHNCAECRGAGTTCIHTARVGDARFSIWLAIAFYQSVPYRRAHNVCAFYLTTPFGVLGVGGRLSRRADIAAEGWRIFKMALGFLTAFVPLQIVLGAADG